MRATAREPKEERLRRETGTSITRDNASDRKGAEGREVTERNLGFSLFTFVPFRLGRITTPL
jgi:hypothetical protein